MIFELKKWWIYGEQFILDINGVGFIVVMLCLINDYHKIIETQGEC